MPRMLLDIQNRGQLAAGMTTYNPAAQPADRHLQGAGHGQRGVPPQPSRQGREPHAANTPAGRPSATSATPPAARTTAATPSRSSGTTCRKPKWFSFAFNGQLANYQELRDELLAKGDYHLARETDTEIIMHEISRELSGDRRPTLIEVMRSVATRFDGAYNIVLLNALGEMLVARDPLGIRPLCYAAKARCSPPPARACALANLGFRRNASSRCRRAQAIVDHRTARSKSQQFARRRGTAHCFFEWIYFANVASTLDDRSVYLSRTRWARSWPGWRPCRIDDDTIVVPVPDTSKAAADAMAFALGDPLASKG